MEKSNLQRLLEINNESHGDYRISGYSGRGMFGKECLGVSTHRDTVFIITQVFRLACQEDMSDEDLDKMITQLSCATQDRLGKGNVVYFPSVEYVDDGNDDEEEDTL